MFFYTYYDAKLPREILHYQLDEEEDEDFETQLTRQDAVNPKDVQLQIEGSHQMQDSSAPDSRQPEDSMHWRAFKGGAADIGLSLLSAPDGNLGVLYNSFAHFATWCRTTGIWIWKQIFPSVKARYSVLNCAVELGDADLFESFLLKAIIKQKWESFGYVLFKRNLRIYCWELLFACILSLDLSQLGGAGNETNDEYIWSGPETGENHLPKRTLSMCLILLLLLFNLWDLRRECVQLYCDKSVYSYFFSDIWNLLDLSQIVMVFCMTGFFFGGKETHLRETLAVFLYIKWFGLLYYLRGFKTFGPLVSMVLQMMHDIRWFLILMLIILIGTLYCYFTFMGAVGKEYLHSDLQGAFDRLWRSFFTLFQALLLVEVEPWIGKWPNEPTRRMLSVASNDFSYYDSEYDSYNQDGHIFPNSFQAGSSSNVSPAAHSPSRGLSDTAAELMGGVAAGSAVSSGPGGAHEGGGGIDVALVFLFMLSMLLIPIVLLNLLIALMSDSYERIQDIYMQQYELLKAELIIIEEMFFTEEMLEEENRYPKFLFVLTKQGYDKRELGKSGWSGVLNSLKFKIAEGFENR